MRLGNFVEIFLDEIEGQLWTVGIEIGGNANGRGRPGERRNEWLVENLSDGFSDFRVILELVFSLGAIELRIVIELGHFRSCDVRLLDCGGQIAGIEVLLGQRDGGRGTRGVRPGRGGRLAGAFFFFPLRTALCFLARETACRSAPPEMSRTSPKTAPILRAKRTPELSEFTRIIRS